MDAIHLDDVKVMFTLKTYPAHTIEGFSKLDVNIPSNEGKRGKQKSAGRNLWAQFSIGLFMPVVESVCASSYCV